jgi:hypothetical protein
MSAYTTDCPPLDGCGPCGTLPPGFVRLRFFFGKRMGVADFVDEQRYHAGKLRFHNQRLHGSGLLCGLGVARQSATDVVLRVGKGAAIDACGREIIVGYDQCIDLEAWYQRVAADRRVTTPTWPAAALDANGNLPLVVAIRYRECAASPEPAPRDTCSCDATGCDLGRVREEFELDLLAPDAPEVTGASPLTPPRAGLDRILGGAVGGHALARGLADAATAPAVDPDEIGWVVLAGFAVKLAPAPTPTSAGHVVDVIGLAGRATLLAETALLQELLRREIGAQLEAGALVDGPEIAALTLAPGGAGFLLDVELTGPVLGATVPSDAFTLARLTTSGTPGWTTQNVTTTFVPATATAPDRLRIAVPTAFLAAGALYRLALDVSRATPIVDDHMRPLLPLRPALQFSLVAPTPGTLALAPAPYAR